MGTSLVGALDTRQLSWLQNSVKNIAALGGGGTASIGFKFVAGFDGTYNDKNHVPDGEYHELLIFQAVANN